MWARDGRRARLVRRDLCREARTGNPHPSGCEIPPHVPARGAFSNTGLNLMTKASNTHADIKDMTFERSLKELEGIVSRLERGDVELEESIAIYERGEALRDHCDRLLRQAEAKVEKIALGADGTPKGTVPLDPE